MEELIGIITDSINFLEVVMFMRSFSKYTSVVYNLFRFEDFEIPENAEEEVP